MGGDQVVAAARSRGNFNSASSGRPAAVVLVDWLDGVGRHHHINIADSDNPRCALPRAVPGWELRSELDAHCLGRLGTARRARS